MALQFLPLFSPFLAVLYVLFALIQALRGKRQGTFAMLLAFVAAAASLAAFVMTSDTPLLRTRLEQSLLLNAIIAFVASLLILLIERRKKNRDPNRSYGMIGIGLSILLALGTYVAPLMSNAVASSTNLISTSTANDRSSDDFQTVSALTPGASVRQDSIPTTPQAPQTGSAAAAVLEAQTGLTAEELTAQVTAGSSIAQLVSAHNGDVQATTTAIKDALDALVASGGRGSQLLSRFGTDTASVADQIVQGQLPAQVQERVLSLLLASGSEQPAGNFQPPANVEATQEPVPQATSAATDATAVAAALTAQTGVSTGDLTTKLNEGSTIADLVAAHNGDLAAVTAAIQTEIDTLIASGGQAAGMFSRMGSDTAALTEQIVQGQLPAQAQQFMIPFLLTGSMPQFGGPGGNNGSFQPPSDNSTGSDTNAFPPPDDNSSFQPPSDNSTGSDTNAFPPPSDDNAGAPASQPTIAPPTATPAPTSTEPPTSTLQRPTRIAFPTDVPTTEATEQADDSASGEPISSEQSASGATCRLIPNYNLNLRDKPDKDTGIVMLSIPTGTQVTADARTTDGWYHVQYDNHDGWVSGEYASVDPDCDALPAQ